MAHWRAEKRVAREKQGEQRMTNDQQGQGAILGASELRDAARFLRSR